MALDDFKHWRLLDPAGRDQPGKHRRLENAEADPQSDADQHDREQERHAPAPAQELIAGHRAECQHGEIGKEQPARHAELRPRRDKPARMVRARPFHRHQH